MVLKKILPISRKYLRLIIAFKNPKRSTPLHQASSLAHSLLPKNEAPHQINFALNKNQNQDESIY
jgi:hypothetical protein